MRLSRKVLTGLVGVGAVVIFSALIWALYQGNRRPGGGSELYNTENKTTPDGLTTLPRDYSGLPQNPPQGAPQLGPPVPGDIGRPQPASALEDPKQQRLAQENEAARTSRLFATTSASERPATARWPLLLRTRKRRRPDRQKRPRSIQGPFSTCRTAKRPS
jgi:type IV secretion system protein TrbI